MRTGDESGGGKGGGLGLLVEVEGHVIGRGAVRLSAVEHLLDQLAGRGVRGLGPGRNRRHSGRFAGRGCGCVAARGKRTCRFRQGRFARPFALLISRTQALALSISQTHYLY